MLFAPSTFPSPLAAPSSTTSAWSCPAAAAACLPAQTVQVCGAGARPPCLPGRAVPVGVPALPANLMLATAGVTYLLRDFAPSKPHPAPAPALLPRSNAFCPARPLLAAGKTSLLQVLAGKYMVGQDAVRILGRPAFHDIQLVSTGTAQAQLRHSSTHQQHMFRCPAPPTAEPRQHQRGAAVAGAPGQACRGLRCPLPTPVRLPSPPCPSLRNHPTPPLSSPPSSTHPPTSPCHPLPSSTHPRPSAHPPSSPSHPNEPGLTHDRPMIDP